MIKSSSDQPRTLGPQRRRIGALGSKLLILGLLAAATVALNPAPSQAAPISIGISVGFAPPPIPVYTQPVCPQPGYMWTPGYWDYDPADGYYWVPGTWVMAPEVGYLWTPGYWGWGGNAFFWHAGYWGPHVGFYGGINYGFGYNGVGFFGGEWRGRDYFYNRNVNNFGGGHFNNVYNTTVVNNYAVNRVSYNGGRGGIEARANSQQISAEHDRHMEATSMQHQQQMSAHNDRGQFASENRGRPGVAATGRPGEFRGNGAVQSSRAGGPVNPESFRTGNNAGHPGGFTPEHSNRAPEARPGEMTHANPGNNNETFHSNNSFHPATPTHSGPPPEEHNFNRGGGNPNAMMSHQNAPESHNVSPRESAPARQQEFHPAAPEQHISHPGGGGEPRGGGNEFHGGGEPHRGGGAPHGAPPPAAHAAPPAPHGGGGAPHGGGEPHGGEPHHR